MFDENLTRKINYKARRSSSYDRSGGNADSTPVAVGETLTVFDMKAVGEIRHIWMAIASEDPFYLRKVLLRMYWDGEASPSVECPAGDFFGLGHSRSYTYSCALFQTTVNDERRQGEGVSLNSWVPMPFTKCARIELVNETSLPLCVYYYIDWREMPSLPEGKVYTFHASWKRENPAKDHADENDPLYQNMKKGYNLTDKYNYRILYAEGEGNFVGVNMSLDNLHGEWWGEGDDMFFIDRDDMTPDCGGQWPPDLHGTGSEDYFCHAWGMQSVYGPFNGESWCEDRDFLRAHNCHGKVNVYRYHIADPIPFEKNIRVSIEHGHANDRNDDIASVAYWYQAEPHSPLSFEKMLPPEERLPRPKIPGRMIATYMK